ncbi:MAG: hypothetical protein KGI75_13350 [Rhizobiaceae bacterium]|nr:hypothetical protein [Rhizobiaceae bacterium]
MKIMAIGSLTQQLTPELQKQIMPKEVPDTLKLYLSGTIEQFWLREYAGKIDGVIFLLSAASMEEAKAAVDALPLTAEGLMSFELLPLAPLLPLGLLLQGR